MSKRVAHTPLAKHTGPILTTPVQQAIERLREALETKSTNGQILEQIGSQLHGYEQITRPTTADSYGWFWALHFRIRSGGVVVALPWAQDWDNADGSRFDRAINVYVQRDWTDAEIVTVLDEFAERARSVFSEESVAA